MKALFAILGFTLTLAGQLRAQSSLSNGLVAYYPFDGNANDDSGNGNNLANFGATLCADRFGNANQAYYFNGSTYLASSISPLTQIDGWTVTAWIRPGTLPQAAAFAVCVGYANGTTGDGYALGIDGLSTGFGGEPGNNVFAALSGVNFTSFGYQFSSTNGWHQVVMLRSAGTLAIYVDGNPTTNINSNPSLTPIAPTSIAIGSGGTSGVYSFVGAVDDVRVYNRPLSATEVQQLYNYEATACTATTATATAVVSDGFVVSATVIDDGCGYTNTPLVQIVGGGGTGATATAVVTNGFVTGITITGAGSGYVTVPAIIISAPAPCVPHSATAVATITNGFVISAAITDSGCGYTNAPSIQIIGGGGNGAVATAVVTNGEVVGITITDAGTGYTNTPAIYLNSPLGVLIGIQQAVAPTFSNLSVGSNYQLQSSGDLVTWTDEGSSFKATNTSMIFPQYFNVNNLNQLYFRLQGAP